MRYQIIHCAQVEADSEEEARKQYVANWKDGFYNETDIDVDDEEAEVTS